METMLNAIASISETCETSARSDLAWVGNASIKMEDIAFETITAICEEARSELKHKRPLAIYWFESPCSDLYNYYVRRLRVYIAPHYIQSLLRQYGLPETPDTGIRSICVDTAPSHSWFALRTGTACDARVTRIVHRQHVAAEIEAAISNGVRIRVDGPHADYVLNETRKRVRKQIQVMAHPSEAKATGRPRKLGVPYSPLPFQSGILGTRECRGTERAERRVVEA